MTKSNHNGNNSDRSDFPSGPQALLELLRERQLNVLGGQDLRGSGFENEEQDPEFNREAEPWQE